MKTVVVFLFLSVLIPLPVVFADEVLLQYAYNIRNLLEQSKIKYAEGDIEEAKRLAMKAYIDNYEYLEDPVEEQNEELNDELEIMLREELQSLMRNNAPLEQVEEKIDALYASSKRIQMYFKWTFIVTIVFFVVPLILSLFAIPYFISIYSSLYSGLY